MKPVSILNDVTGPVMRGPSSSHTAGSHHIASLARSLLGDEPRAARFCFDPGGSYGKVYTQQGADRALAAGLMGWSILDDRFADALEQAERHGLSIAFEVRELPDADHPNFVRIRLDSRAGRRLDLDAKSTGGGGFEVTRLGGWPVCLTGDCHEIVAEVERKGEADVRDLLEGDKEAEGDIEASSQGELTLLLARRRSPLSLEARSGLERNKEIRNLWIGTPVFFIQRGDPLFRSAAEMTALAEEQNISLGRTALKYEAALLGLSEEEVLKEALRRLDIMRDSVRRGLEEPGPRMQLLEPTASRILAMEAQNKLALGGLHTRAAARAMAAMQTCGGMDVVCAAPTAGSAGVLPAVLTTWMEELGLDREDAALALLAGGAVGVILATRATFAAEIAGCQVEIGAAGAMASAAVVDAAEGSAAQAADAAAISFQNTMGSVCDLVQGIVEIPCHTRNAAAASSAFVNADVIMGGYKNPIPLDETIDAVYSVGKMLPAELRVTSLGGLAQTPSARAMKPRR